MALVNVDNYLKLAPVVRGTPHSYLWSSYDAEADTLRGPSPTDEDSRARNGRLDFVNERRERVPRRFGADANQ